MKKSKNKGFLSKFGEILVKALPIVIKILGVVGTIALILVSGGIFLHNIDYIHHIIPHTIPSTIIEFGLGIIFGLVAVLLMTIFKKISSKLKSTKS